MKRNALTVIQRIVMTLVLTMAVQLISAQQRRPIDSQHPLWLIHIDVWNKADPQKIIDLIPDDVKPYVCMNLSLSCQYDTETDVYKMPQNAIRTYKSWASICQHNGMWFTCQPASGGHTHIQDDDLETFEYFYKHYPNFLGWNYAEQFWGFDEVGDKSSSTQASRIALFAKLVPMAHKYGGFLTVSFCGNIWSHPLNPVGMMKRNSDLLEACRQYPEAILWLYKYTTSSCFYNNESVTLSPFISGLAANYGVRYDNCGWNGALDALLGENHGKKYPIAAGIGTVMEQTCVNGGAVWDGPELIWTEDFQNLANTTVNGYTRRNWGTFPGFRGAWLDMFRKIIDGTMYVPTREEVVGRTKIVVVNDITSGSDEQKYAAWGDLYDGLYKQADPFNRNNGQWMDNFCYFKRTGRYAAIPVAIGLYDEVSRSIPVQVKKSEYTTRWPTQARKQVEFNRQYPEVSTGDLYVSRFKNQLVTYTPYTYINSHTSATSTIPLEYNTCEQLTLTYGKLGSGVVREYADHIDFYLNNFRTDTTDLSLSTIVLNGCSAEPTYTLLPRTLATAEASAQWDEASSTYTLSVRHLGPIDLSVQCEGTATERSTDLASSTPLSLSLPQQPQPYHGPIIVEAEDMDYKNVASCVTDPYNWYPSVRGHSGNGFIDMGTSTSGALRHTLTLAAAGDYRIDIRYTSSNRSGAIAVAANSSRKALRLNKTGVNEWRKATVETTLREGANTLTITNSAGLDCYIDNVTYTPADCQPEQFAVNIRQVEHGHVEASLDSAAEGETVSLAVTPEEGYILAGWTVVHGSIVVADDNTFVMPDDNVTLAPVFADITAVYALDFADVLSGTIPQGWIATQENDEQHAYPQSYSSGARSLAGFTGYQGKALYWRVNRLEYGSQDASLLTLAPADYRLSFAMAAWKGTPSYRAEVIDSKGNVVAQSGTYTATPNVNGSTSASIASATLCELPFSVTTAGNYVVRFVNAYQGSFSEFLLLDCRINTVPLPDAVNAPFDATDAVNRTSAIYGLEGTQRTHLRPGINIVRHSDGTIRKFWIK